MKRVCIVTGGTRGIGAAISQEMLRRGHNVIANYAGNDEGAQQFHKQTGIPVMKWDVSDYNACQENIKNITEQYGAVDILINNAGITRDGFMHKSTPEMWNQVIATNLTSCFNLSHCVITGMRERGFGRIISISSINGQKGQAGQVNYCAAKAGIIGFTKALALENANKGVTVNVVAPGYIDTDMVRAVSDEVMQKIVAQIPVGRLGTAAEVSHMVGFLAEENSGFITGSTFTVNGGQYMA